MSSLGFKRSRMQTQVLKTPSWLSLFGLGRANCGSGHRSTKLQGWQHNRPLDLQILRPDHVFELRIATTLHCREFYLRILLVCTSGGNDGIKNVQMPSMNRNIIDSIIRPSKVLRMQWKKAAGSAQHSPKIDGYTP